MRPPRRRARYRVKRVAFRRLCRSSANSINRSMSVTALAATGLAQIQPAPQASPGRTSREALYLRLFREMDRFEAQADALEAQGVAATNLREYHQKWLRLSPGRAAQLKQVAAECLRELRLLLGHFRQPNRRRLRDWSLADHDHRLLRDLVATRCAWLVGIQRAFLSGRRGLRL